jgi:hypothetical protein
MPKYVVTMTRPSLDVPFFSEVPANASNLTEFGDALAAISGVIYSRLNSDDGLQYTATFDCSTSAALKKVVDLIKDPKYNAGEAEYNTAQGITDKLDTIA